MPRAGWIKRSVLVLALAAFIGGAECPISPPMSDMGEPAEGGIVTLRLENESGFPVIVTARYTIDDTQVRETVRKLDPSGNDAVATVLATRTRFLEIIAVAGENIDPAKSALVKTGDTLRQGKFQWQVDFHNDDTFVFVIPPLEPPGPPGGQTVDCNSNGVADALDISNGTSLDCDNDGIPDECDASLAAHDPFPEDGRIDLPTDVILSWNQVPPAPSPSSESAPASLQRFGAGHAFTTVDRVQMTALRESATALSEFYSATGRIFVSIDGGGSNNASHTIDVEKPSEAATVRKAFVIAVSTGFSERQLNDGDVRVSPPDIGVNWDLSVQSSIFSYNHLADVTAQLSPTIDAAPAGRIGFSFSEVDTQSIDGEALIVVFDDPAQTSDRTAILLFGAQNIAGDSFGITLGEPIDPDAPDALATMSLGISFGFQPGRQVSLVDVNGQRLTSSAGGQDDGPAGCAGFDGELITVGGLDDSTDNPIDPLAGSSSCRSDDEYYSLLPFINGADTQITVTTSNPSNDDNIFFGAFVLSGAAVLGEGIVLSPTGTSDPIGAAHTVVATVTNDLSQPVVGRDVSFTILSGPNQGVNGIVATGADGQAHFTYAGTGGVGTDQLQASFVDSQSQTRVSNVVTQDWTPPCNLHYTVKLDTNPTPGTVLCNDTTSTTCHASSLDSNTTYFWQVITSDGVNETPGPVWSFKTNSQ